MSVPIKHIVFISPIVQAITYLGETTKDRYSVVWDGEMYVIRDLLNGNEIFAEVHPHNVSYRVRAEEKKK